MQTLMFPFKINHYDLVTSLPLCWEPTWLHPCLCVESRPGYTLAFVLRADMVTSLPLCWEPTWLLPCLCVESRPGYILAFVLRADPVASLPLCWELWPWQKILSHSGSWLTFEVLWRILDVTLQDSCYNAYSSIVKDKLCYFCNENLVHTPRFWNTLPMIRHTQSKDLKAK